MLAHGVVRDLAADQRVAHLARAVAHAVGGGDGIFRLHQAEAHLSGAVADAAAQAVVDRLDLALDAQIALRIALVADHADGRFVDQADIGAQRARDADRLRVAAGVVVEKHGSGFCHG